MGRRVLKTGLKYKIGLAAVLLNKNPLPWMKPVEEHRTIEEALTTLKNGGVLVKREDASQTLYLLYRYRWRDQSKGTFTILGWITETDFAKLTQQIQLRTDGHSSTKFNGKTMVCYVMER